jgi:RNA polymerase sigma factor (sigma-70 family)
MSARTAALLCHLRRLAPVPCPEPDAVLLARFARGRDEAAFAALVERHGPMVLRVCRRAVGDAHAAEDCFQAVFLVLARKAGTLRRPAALAGWLHGVALRVARKAHAAALRGRPAAGRKDAPEPADPRPDPLAALSARELLTILDDEVRRLPRAYREAVVLCCLEGRGQGEAARLLGCTPGAVKGRLERGRARLQVRLLRRGLSLPVVLLAAGLGPAEASALPAAAVAATAGAAVAFAVGRGAGPSAEAVALAEGALRAMTVTPLKAAAILVLALGLAAGASVQGLAPRAAEHPPAPAASLPQDKTGPGPAARLDRFGDPLPADALARLGTVRLRHGQGIFAVAFAPDGRSVASGGLDGAVCLWDPGTGKELLRIEDRLFPDSLGLGAVLGLAFAPDGRTLAATRLNGPACLFDLATGKEVRQFGGERHRAAWVVFAPGGKVLAYGGSAVSGQEDPVIRLADPATGKDLRRLEGHRGGVAAVRFSPGGKLLASVGADKTARLWDVASGRQLHQLPAEPNPEALAFAPDGRLLAAAGPDGSVGLFDPDSGKQVRHLAGHRSAVRALAFSPDGKTLASASEDETVRLWDVDRGAAVRTLPNTKARKNNDGGLALRFTPDGRTLIGQQGRLIRLWEPGSGKELRKLEADAHVVTGLALSPDGTALAAACHVDRTIRLWDVPGGKPLARTGGHDGGVAFLAVSPDGRRVATSAYDGTTRVWDAATGRQLRQFDRSGPCAFTPDGESLISGGLRDGTVRAWDLATGRELWQFRDHPGSIRAMALTPDGKRLVTAGNDSTLRLWDLTTRRLVHDFGGKQAEWPHGLALSADGATLASLHNNRGVRLWDVASGKLLRHLPMEGDCTTGSLAFAPDGRTLAASCALNGGRERAVRLWDVATGAEVRRLPGHGGPLDALAFSPDGRTLLWGGQHETTLWLWEVRTGGVRRQLRGHRDQIACVAFTPDGRRLVSGSADGTALVWDACPPARAAGALPAEELDRLWAALADKDAARGYEAMRALAGAPRQAAALVRGHVPPVPRADPRRLERLLSELDGDDFGEREAAARELERAGAGAEQALRRALGAKPSAEVRRRAEGLLAKLEEGRLLEDRAVEVLEAAATAETRQVLQDLAGGEAGAWLTREAKASLERLARRPAPAP